MLIYQGLVRFGNIKSMNLTLLFKVLKSNHELNTKDYKNKGSIVEEN